MRIAEWYGPVFQGEGPQVGLRASFLRTGLCNLSCSWCDTPFTWDATRYDLDVEAPERDEAWIADKLVEQDDGRTLLVVTGGEPMMWQRQLVDVAGRWSSEVSVETNGTVKPLPSFVERVGLFVVSPKVAQDDDPESKRIKLDTLREYAATRSVLKFVARNADDVTQAARVADLTGYEPERVWIMPEGVTTQQIADGAVSLVDPVLAHGFQLSLRNHVIMYGDRRGT